MYIILYWRYYYYFIQNLSLNHHTSPQCNGNDLTLKHIISSYYDQ